MNKVQFITQAAAQQLNLSNMNVDMLKPEQMELILDGQCIGCGCNALNDADYDENGIVTYTQDLFCEGCVDHLPAEVLLAHGIISQKEYDTLCDPFDLYDPMDSNDLRDILDPEYDCSPPTQYWEEPSVGGMFDCGDDELPF